MRTDIRPLILIFSVFFLEYVDSRPSVDAPLPIEFRRAVNQVPQVHIFNHPWAITHVRDWRGRYYGIKVNDEYRAGMTFPLGTYQEELHGTDLKVSFWRVQPRDGDTIFRRETLSARVYQHGIYQTYPDGALVTVDGRSVIFHPENEDILSEDGVHRLAVYQEGFRLYLTGYQNPIHPPDGQMSTTQ